MTEDARHKETKIWYVSIRQRTIMIVEADNKQEAEDKALNLFQFGEKPTESDIESIEIESSIPATEYY